MGCGSACTLWVSFPSSGLGLAAPSISFLFLSCAARVLSTVAHEKLHLGNKQPLADTAEMPCTQLPQPRLCIPAVHAEPTPAAGFVSAQESLHRALGLHTHRSFPENPQDEPADAVAGAGCPGAPWQCALFDIIWCQAQAAGVTSCPA